MRAAPCFAMQKTDFGQFKSGSLAAGLGRNQNHVFEKQVMIRPYDSFFIVKYVDGVSVEVRFELTVRARHSDSNDRLRKE